MAFSEYGDYDALGLAGLLRERRVTPAELLDEALARIEVEAARPWAQRRPPGFGE